MTIIFTFAAVGIAAQDSPTIERVVMADNRLLLKCTVCGDEFVLAKSYYDGMHVCADRFDFVNRLNAFFEQHTYHNDGNVLTVDLLGTNYVAVNEIWNDEQVSFMCHMHELNALHGKEI